MVDLAKGSGLGVDRRDSHAWVIRNVALGRIDGVQVLADTEVRVGFGVNLNLNNLLSGVPGFVGGIDAEGIKTRCV